MKELPKAYVPADYERQIYDAWEKAGAFKPASDGSPERRRTHKPYTIIMPPPNATGRLHTGHAIMLAIEDALVRYHRMKGFDTLYLPGTDHAAIATENVVEKELLKEGTTKQDLGREAFVKRATDWAADHRHIIQGQMRAMGASADWSRDAFTMDEPRRAAVRVAFRQLYEKGLVYRGSYMVNWCPHCRTVLADDEVEHTEREGILYYMKYGPFVLATTRPETKVGDTAVAVHPTDDRYTEWIGKTVEVATINGPRELKVIGDDMVNPDFGTGVVKITPFHDKNDYAVGLRHHLPAIEVIGEDGTMTEAAGSDLAGLDRFKARTKMVEWLKENDLLVEEKVMQHVVGRCYRSGDVIEPRISKQWFLRVSNLVPQALAFVDREELKFVPARFEKTYRDWLENLHDWCISRQVWFGHPIPVYENAAGKTSLEPKTGYEPSTDTLDTWFSSALWPFSTMGWPEKSEDFDRFFPGDILETGYDIIFFWITRMVLMTVALDARDAETKELKPPFHTAYLHGLVRDKRGRKFSKSLGNGIDPLELIEQYGADALRFMLVSAGSPGNDLRFDNERVVAARNFGNKLWNVSRFILSQGEASSDLAGLDPDTLSTFDRAILHRLRDVSRQVESAFYDARNYNAKPQEFPHPRPNAQTANYGLGRAANLLYDFLWSDLADWYLEAAKVRLQSDDASQAHNPKLVLRFVLETVLKLLHPFMPFVTEAIWQQGLENKDALMLAAWPELPESLSQPEDWERFTHIRELVETIRRLRNEHGTPAGAWVQAAITLDEPGWLMENADEIKQLARLDKLEIAEPTKSQESLEKTAVAVVGGSTVSLPLAGLVDEKAEQTRLQGEVEQAKIEVQRLTERLENKDYATKAPSHLVAQTRAKLDETKERLATLETKLG